MKYVLPLVTAVVLMITVVIFTSGPDLKPAPLTSSAITGKTNSAVRKDNSPEKFKPTLANVEKTLKQKTESSTKEVLTEEDEVVIPPHIQRVIDSREVALEQGYGKLKPITADNPQFDSVKEALATGNFPERLSAHIQPAPFDREKYLSDASFKEQYLNTIEPGRVHQTLTPAAGVTALKRVSNYYTEMVQSQGSVELSVQAEPGMPVVFYASQNGRFSNGLTTINVEAAADGTATASFTAGTGVIDDCRIKAGSPACSGSVNFIVHVLLSQQEVNKFKEVKGTQQQ